MKKYIAELIGTATLTGIGCGTAMLVGCDAGIGAGYLIVALAFGLSIVAMAYSIGNISGCHINPAVSLGILINGGMNFKDFIGYVIAQILGAFAGILIMLLIFTSGNINDMTGDLGANGLSGVNGSAGAGLLVEIVLTFIFVTAILGVTSKIGSHGSFGGLVIGLSLIFVHLIGIGLTGCSVNPARSIAPAVIDALKGDAHPLSELWVFIVGPLIGSALAALVWKYLSSNDGKETTVSQESGEVEQE